MKLKKYKNKYGHERVKCPFCSHEAYVQSTSKYQLDPLRGLKQHIKNQAKNEALEVLVEGGKNTEHLDYFKKHTAKRKVVLTTVRNFDDDLTI